MDQNSLFMALADPTRREILRLLKSGDATPGDLAERFTITKPSLSHHLDILKRAGLVTTERRGQFIWYSLNLSVVEESVAFFMEMFDNVKLKEGRCAEKKLEK